MARRRANHEGSIFWSEAQNLWAAEIVLPDGKKKRKRSKRQSVVREWLEKEKEAVRGGSWVSGEAVKYGDFLDRYLTEVATHTLRPSTLYSYSDHIKNHIKPAIGDIKITNVRPEHLQRMYSNLLNRGLSKGTVKKTHAVVRKSLGIALNWGLVGRNVALAVSPPSPDTFEIKPLTVPESKQLLKVLEGDRLYAFYVLLLATGIRRGECLALQKQNLSLEEGTITIKQSLSFIVGKGLILGEPKSQKSNRRLVLPPFALEALKTHLMRFPNTSKYIFATGNNTPFSPRNVVRHFKKKLGEAGLPIETRIHDLRHSYASWLLQNTSVKDVQMLLGHAQASTTLEIYAHVLPGYNFYQATTRKLLKKWRGCLK
jgi:integrase